MKFQEKEEEEEEKEVTEKDEDKKEEEEEVKISKNYLNVINNARKMEENWNFHLKTLRVKVENRIYLFTSVGDSRYKLFSTRLDHQ